RAEIALCLDNGATAERLSFGNTIKKERDIAFAYAAGVRLFAFDSEAELEKLARAAPGARVFCRILVSCEGADWPLSRKFGCAPGMAVELLRRARDLRLDPPGAPFHLRPQQPPRRYRHRALGPPAHPFPLLARAGVHLHARRRGARFRLACR